MVRDFIMFQKINYRPHGLRGGGLPVPEGMDQRYRDSFRALLNLTVPKLGPTGRSLAGILPTWPLSTRTLYCSGW